jgi:hypothetical protein
LNDLNDDENQEDVEEMTECVSLEALNFTFEKGRKLGLRSHLEDIRESDFTCIRSHILCRSIRQPCKKDARAASGLPSHSASVKDKANDENR